MRADIKEGPGVFLPELPSVLSAILQVTSIEYSKERKVKKRVIFSLLLSISLLNVTSSKKGPVSQ